MNDQRSKVITHPLKLTLLAHGHKHRIDVHLNWAAARHVEVQIVFWPGKPEEMAWVVARDLLAEGLADDPVGDGDVHIRRHWGGDHLREVTLASPSGVCTLLIEVAELRAFLSKTWGYVEHGSEQPLSGICSNCLVSHPVVEPVVMFGVLRVLCPDCLSGWVEYVRTEEAAL
jgi:hypothetical protein